MIQYQKFQLQTIIFNPIIGLKIPKFQKNLLKPDMNGDVIIKRKAWSNFRFDAYIKEIQTWLIENKLELESNFQEKLLLQIKNISFPHLKILNISHNNIQSLENLDRISMPKLQQIYLDNNPILSVSLLRKIHSPSLKTISWLYYRNLYIGQQDNKNPMLLNERFKKISQANFKHLQNLFFNFQGIKQRGTNAPSLVLLQEKILIKLETNVLLKLKGGSNQQRNPRLNLMRRNLGAVKIANEDQLQRRFPQLQVQRDNLADMFL